MQFGILVFMLTIIKYTSAEFETNYSVKVSKENDTKVSHILSRRKRYLIFPDGSSFQLGTYNFNIHIYYSQFLDYLISKNKTNQTTKDVFMLFNIFVRSLYT